MYISAVLLNNSSFATIPATLDVRVGYIWMPTPKSTVECLETIMDAPPLYQKSITQTD